LDKGRVISDGIVFQLGSTLTKMNQTTVSQLFNHRNKMRAGDLVHFCEDGTKLEIPSEITPPLTWQKRGHLGHKVEHKIQFGLK
jgi:hypothetical protein